VLQADRRFGDLHVDEETRQRMKVIRTRTPFWVEQTFRNHTDEPAELTPEVTADDLLVVSAQAAALLYNGHLGKVPRQLVKLSQTSFSLSCFRSRSNPRDYRSSCESAFLKGWAHAAFYIC